MDTQSQEYPHPQLKLDNQLCFAIYASSREMTKMYQPLLDHLGLTYSQYLVMLVLWEQQECTVKELGNALYLDSGTLTPLLKRLEAAGLIIRKRSTEDERKVHITLTEAGWSLQQQAVSIPDDIKERTCINTDKLDELLLEFKQLLQNIHQANVNGAANKK
ncbi:MarR family winged helix-turn-helix transcriptional regulator [Paenibacillus dauci]|uniref:MarR family winged helix-turn-helix transcriptional regulator n=1 Tax=Paenibacillus dauci TaxID=1567106 RepID=UPI0006197907|nr:MarR family transcriptional regulator [Paenibacillus dauci]